MKLAFITGITGQDGSYLAELLLEKGYKVHGIIRRSSIFNTERINHILSEITLHYSDITDLASLMNIFSELKKLNPKEFHIYNLAAQSHVKVSFEIPIYTAQTDAIGILNILECMKILNLNAKLYQASTSELYGDVQEIPQKETTQFYPKSPYGVAKLYAYWITKNYKESYNFFISNGILFNHESPRRGKTFVTRKITQSVARISKGSQEVLYLGNLNAKRDWGYAKDYCKGMIKMLEQNKCDDYILATGEQHTVREFVEIAFNYIGIKIEWSGKDVKEKGYSGDKLLVAVNEKYFRPSEVNTLLGDYSKAKKELGWEPQVKFKQLVEMMVYSDIKQLN